MRQTLKTLSDRIRFSRTHANLTQEELARQVGISQTAIHKLECGQSRSSRKIVQIALSCGIEPIWLETGRGSKYRDQEIKPPVNTAREELFSWVPLLPWERVGATPHQHEVDRHLPAIRQAGRQSFALEVPHKDFEPDFQEGDFLVVDPQKKPRHNNRLLVRMAEGAPPTLVRLSVKNRRRYMKLLLKGYHQDLLPLKQANEVLGVVTNLYRAY